MAWDEPQHDELTNEGLLIKHDIQEVSQVTFPRYFYCEKPENVSTKTQQCMYSLTRAKGVWGLCVLNIE